MFWTAASTLLTISWNVRVIIIAGWLLFYRNNREDFLVIILLIQFLLIQVCYQEFNHDGKQLSFRIFIKNHFSNINLIALYFIVILHFYQWIWSWLVVSIVCDFLLLQNNNKKNFRVYYSWSLSLFLISENILIFLMLINL